MCKSPMFGTMLVLAKVFIYSTLAYLFIILILFNYVYHHHILSVILQIRRWIRQNLLLVLTFISVILGVLLGFLIRMARPSDTTVLLLSYPGEIFMNILKLLVLPLIITSVISGLSQLDVRSSGRIGFYACMYYMLTTFVAVVLGISLVLLIHPGDVSTRLNLPTAENKSVHTLDTILDLIRNMFPENIIQAAIQQVQTIHVPEEVNPHASSAATATNATVSDENVINNMITKLVRKLEFKPGINVLGALAAFAHSLANLTITLNYHCLGIIVFCIAFGMMCAYLGKRVVAVVSFFDGLNHIIIALTSLAIWYSPIGILSMIIGRIVNIADLAVTAQMLGLYMTTVLLGLIIHCLAVLPLIFLLSTRQNPYKFMRGILKAWITAIGTSSSAATLPVTFRCMEEENHVDKRVTSFILPVGATINMDGTALYEAVAAIFIAQMNGINLTFGQVVIVRY
ncbi:unnamed protein product [Soboliphyme baturini]|uniref:Amino acid transporter n=1 Tax=Soboliphyme baturini TaxID=241478 RepID=A0A183IY85_9BILA|nr:unnamed protein product [Soboliphyme baturini]